MNPTCKRILSLLLVFVLLIGLTPTAFAASTGYDIPQVGDQTFIDTNVRLYHNGNTSSTQYVVEGDSSYGSEFSLTQGLRRITYRVYGTSYYDKNYDPNSILYCIEYGMGFGGNMLYTAKLAAGHSYWTGMSDWQKTGILLAIGYGYPNSSASELGVPTSDDAIAAAQALVWEFDTGIRTSFDGSKPLSEQLSNTYFYDYIIKGSPAEPAYWKMLELMNTYYNDRRFDLAELTNNDRFIIWTLSGSQTLMTFALPDDTGPPSRPTYDEARIAVNKVDENGNGLAGAEFLAVNQSTGMGYRIGPTDANGYAISAYLPLGTYTVIETVFPDGYTSGDVTEWTVVLDGTAGVETVTITAVNKRNTATVEVVKTSSDGVVDGITFTVKNNTAGTSGTYTTANGGKFSFTATVGDSITITETVPADYTNSASSQTITVAASGNTVKFHNTLKPGYIKIVKDTSDGNNLTGWRFRVVNNSTGSVVGTYTITSGNSVTVGPVDANTAYTITEIVPTDSAYEPADNPKSVTVLPDETVTVTFLNELKFGVGRIVKETTNGGSKAGWTFTIQDSSGTTIGTYATDDSGIIAVDLLPGTYTVTEISSTKEYWHNDPVRSKTLTVEAGKTSSVTFTNEYKGKGQIIKETTNGGAKDGWTFSVTDSSGILIGTYTTDSTGIITLDLEPGTYTVTETNSEKAFWHNDPVSSKTLTVEAGKTSSVTFTNEFKGKGQIFKQTTNGGATDGWTFTVTDSSGTLIGTYTTNRLGLITLDLEPGTYTVTETSPASEYWINDPEQSKTLTVEAGKLSVVRFTNEYLGKLAVTKSTNTGLYIDNWRFGIYTDIACTDASLVEIITSGTDGRAVSGLLEPGTYYVKELDRENTSDYLSWSLDTSVHTVVVSAGSTAEVGVYNEYYGRIRMVKTTNTGENLDGWLIGVFTDPECTQPINGSPFVTGSDGTVYTTVDGTAASAYLPLTPGSTYYVKELGRQDGNISYWDMDTTVHTVTIEDNETQSVTFHNIHRGLGKIIKTTNTNVDLDGWIIDIYSDEALTTKVGELTTDDNGNAQMYLEPGTYWFVERSNGDPYWICDTAPRSAEIKPGEDTTVTFDNHHMGRIQIVKRMATDGPVDGWQFKITDEAGNEIPGSPFTTAEAEINGETVGVILTDLLEPGTYIVEEIIPENSLYYCKTENPVTVTVAPGATSEVSFTNALRPGKITVDKVNWEGEYLSGATFLLEWSEDGINWYPVIYSDAEDVVKGGCSNPALVDGCVTTDDSGKLEFGNLYPSIQYRLTETAAPDGYVLMADYAYLGTLPIEDLTVSLTVHNSRGYQLPTTPSTRFDFVTIGTVLAILALMACLVHLTPPVSHGKAAVKNNYMKGKTKMKKSLMRLFSLLLVLCVIGSMAISPAFAAEIDEATIHMDRPCKLTIYAYDWTNAAKDGIWSQQSYVSTGQYDANVNDILGTATRDGDDDSESILGNGSKSNGYAIKGVQYTYLKVAEPYQFTESEKDGKTYSHVELLFKFDKDLAADLLKAIGLPDGKNSYENANALDSTAWFYQSDVLNKALADALANNSTTVKNALEAYVQANGGTAMPLTDENGRSIATDMEVGLYLLVETLVPEMVTSTTNPFFVSLPMTNVNGGGDGTNGNTTSVTDGGHTWLYDVTVYPKSSTGIVTLEKTVREAVKDTGTNGGTGSMTDGYAHYATASTGDTVEFQIISTLPTITASASTGIREYTFQDVLERGLSYDSKTPVVIEIYKDKSCTELVTTWGVDDGKFTISKVENVDGSHTMTIAMTSAGLAEINAANTVAGNNNGGLYAGYSNYTMRITYAAILNSDESMVYGDAGNCNEVVLTWRRSSASYYDTLVDDCHIFSYGINIIKKFSDGKDNQDLFDHVLFKVQNKTDDYYVIAELNEDEGIWYVTGHTTKESAATAIHPVSWNGLKGQIVIKGLENDEYILTEIETADGYFMLEKSISVVISAADDPTRPCDVYDSDVLGVIQNDSRFSFDGGLDLQLANIPQAALAHNYLTASATIDGNPVDMLEDEMDAGSTNALAPLEVTNTHGFDLPQTGEVGAILLTTAGAMVTTFSIVLPFFGKKRREEDPQQ